MRRAFFLYPALRYPYYKNTKEPSFLHLIIYTHIQILSSFARTEKNLIFQAVELAFYGIFVLSNAILVK